MGISTNLNMNPNLMAERKLLRTLQKKKKKDVTTVALALKSASKI
jgi:hypothetical protein